MGSFGYQIILKTDDLRIGQHIYKVLREKYSQGILEVRVETIDSQAAVSLTIQPENLQLYRLFELVELQVRRFRISIAKTRFTTQVPLEILTSCVEYYLKAEKLNIEQVVNIS